MRGQRKPYIVQHDLRDANGELQGVTRPTFRNDFSRETLSLVLCPQRFLFDSIARTAYFAM